MILITGANGNFGKATIASLLNKGVAPQNIAALVRSEEKGKELAEKGVTVKIGDYDNYSSLLEAFSGIEKVLLVSGSDISKRDQQHENVIRAARESGVKHILYTSIDRKTDSTDSPLAFVLNSHMAAEEAIKASGMAYTILRNNLYMDMLPWYLGEQVLETGVYFPAGEGKAGFVLRPEMAEATANILIGEGHEGKEYAITHPEEVSFGEIAEMLSTITGKEINYYSPEKEEYIDRLIKAGVPEEYTGVLAGFADAIKKGELSSGKSDITALLGRQPSGVKQFLSQVYGK